MPPLPSQGSPVATGTQSPVISPLPQSTRVSLPALSPSNVIALPTGKGNINVPTARQTVAMAGLSNAVRPSYGTPTAQPIFQTQSQMINKASMNASMNAHSVTAGTMKVTTKRMEEIRQGSLEGKLHSHGYAVTDKVVVKRADGGQESRYLKVLTSSGSPALVMIDEEGYVVESCDGKIRVEVSNSNWVPASTKMGALECTGNEVCGVALNVTAMFVF